MWHFFASKPPSKDEVIKDIRSLKTQKNTLIIDSNSDIDFKIKSKKATLIIDTDLKNAKIINENSKAIEDKIKSIKGIKEANVLITAEKEKSSPPPEPPKKSQKQNKIMNPMPVKGVKKIILVSSGKGGVGKSTVAVNLALALSKQDKKIGLLDADIYGPSIPMMLDINDKPIQNEDKSIEPIEKFGIKAISIGLMVKDSNQALIWRGAMVQSAIMQLINDVNWGDIDILIIDMPPGTGDIALTLAQKVKIDGAVIVSTPQDISLIDAKKGIEMFKKVNIPILGLIENMSSFICPNCNHEEYIFGENGVEAESEKQGIKLLGKIPLNKSIREHADSGNPIVMNDDLGKVNQAYFDIAIKLQ